MTGLQESSTRTRALRVLFADDNKVFVDLVEYELTHQKRGHIVVVARTGDQAWLKFCAATTPFDVVITDHQMPGLTGFELLKKIIATNFPGKLVVASAVLTKDDVQRYHAIGDVTVVHKSAGIDGILAALDQVRPSS